jgi:hypothetical protein
MIILRIKKKEFDLIKSGEKKSEWRFDSEYNRRLLLKDRGDGMRDGNLEINEIKLINGYTKDSPSLIVKVISIRAVFFTKDISIPQDNFTAKKGMRAIEIKIGEIIDK